MQKPDAGGGLISVGDVLGAGIDLVRRNFRVLAIVTAWGAFPSYAAIDLSTAMIQSSRGSLAALGVILAILGFIGLGLLSAAVTIGCARLVHPAEDLNHLDPLEVYAHAALRLWPLALMLVIWAVLAAPLAILLPIGIYLAIRGAMSFTAIVLEGAGPLESFRLSWALTRGAWWYTAILILVGTLVTALVGFVLSWAFAALATPLGDAAGVPALTGALSTMGKALSLIATEPFSAAIMVVLYYALCARSASVDLTEPATEFPAPRESDPSSPLAQTSRRAT